MIDPSGMFWRSRGEQEGAKKRSRTCSRSPGSKLGKRCQLGCSDLDLLLGSSCSVFHRKKGVYS
jgi:hypothetical protein